FSVDQGLYTANLYEQWENSRTSNSYDDYCGTPEEPLHNDRRVRNICATILNYLETKYSASDHTTDAYDVCTLLNYWAYNRLNIVLHSNNSKYINQKFGEIIGIWNTFNEVELNKPENKTCKPISNIVAYDDWKKRKELYEYYVDYSPINTYLDFYPSLCKKFYKYVESKKSLYKYFNKHCPSNNENVCPKFYTKCEQYDPEKVLHTLPCHQEIITERKTAVSSLSRIGKGLSVIETDSEETDDRMMTFDPPKFSGNPHTVTKFGNVFLGVVATTMTSGALYRFTPLGGMIRNGLRWNNNNMGNFNGGDIRLYDYASEPFNPYSGAGEEHYIGYHPA
ncbi:hypothetical protein PVBG_05989, partial [Plasmodium vivax Brazil I]